jgi:hypothetical protein
MLSSCHRVVSTYLSVASEVNQNITAAKKELLKWHWRLGHAGFLDAVDGSNTSESPKFVSCQMTKQARRGPEVHRKPKNEGKDNILQRNNLQTGDMVSVYQYMSVLPGRLPNTKGKENKKDQYCGGTIFVDHASSKIFLKRQVSLNTGKTVPLKKSFEREAMSSGMKIKAYHDDNVAFNSEEWK